MVLKIDEMFLFGAIIGAVIGSIVSYFIYRHARFKKIYEAWFDEIGAAMQEGKDYIDSMRGE